MQLALTQSPNMCPALRMWRPAQGARCRAPRPRPLASKALGPAPGARRQAPWARHPAPESECLGAGVQAKWARVPAPGVRVPAPGARFPAPGARIPAQGASSYWGGVPATGFSSYGIRSSLLSSPMWFQSSLVLELTAWRFPSLWEKRNSIRIKFGGRVVV